MVFAIVEKEWHLFICLMFDSKIRIHCSACLGWMLIKINEQKHYKIYNYLVFVLSDR